MVNNEKLSVIVTIYNREKYLCRCLDSIVNQTYKNLEIILVDDGSTDDSYKIMESYAQNDERVKIFHKENGGVVSCWKYGLSKVTANYLTMVDSDDWLELDTFSKMMEIVEKYDVDMVVCSSKSSENNVQRKSKYSGLYKDNISFIYNNVYNRRTNDFMPICRWGKVYKTQLYLTTQECNYGGNFFEDMFYVTPLYFKAKSIYFINEPLYIYFSNENSMSNAKYNKGDIKKYNELFEKFLAQPNVQNEDYKRRYDILGYFLYIKIALLLFSDLTKKDKIYELKDVMNCNATKKTIKYYKKIGFEKSVLKLLLRCRCYKLIVALKGTK